MSLQLDRGVVGYWCPMLATTGLRLYDRSGRSNHGTLTGMDAATDWVNSKYGKVLDFDGSNDHVQIKHAKSLDLTNALSMSFWAKTGSSVASIGILSAKAIVSPLALSYRVWIQSRLNFQISQDGGTTNVGTRQSSVLLPNTWYHFAVRFQGSVIQDVFVDGRLDNAAFTGTIRASCFSAATPLLIGAQAATSSTTSNPYLGQIAEVAIWNRALAASEIRMLHRLGPGRLRRRSSRVLFYSEQFAAGFKTYWGRRQSQLIGGGL